MARAKAMTRSPLLRAATVPGGFLRRNPGSRTVEMGKEARNTPGREKRKRCEMPFLWEKNASAWTPLKCGQERDMVSKESTKRCARRTLWPPDPAEEGQTEHTPQEELDQLDQHEQNDEGDECTFHATDNWSEEEGPTPCGPAEIASGPQVTSGQFDLTTKKPLRLEKVKGIIRDAFDAAIGNGEASGSPRLRQLNLANRRDVLSPRESSTVAKELIAAVERAMLAAGYKGLAVPLVREELYVLRDCIAEKPWDREGPLLRNPDKKSKVDAWYVGDCK